MEIIALPEAPSFKAKNVAPSIVENLFWKITVPVYIKKDEKVPISSLPLQIHVVLFL